MSDFRSTITSLWFRLMSLGTVGLVFAEALLLAQGKVQGWTFYLTPSEVVFEVVVRLIFAALAGIFLGTVCAAILGPFLWYFEASRERLAEWATRVVVVLVVFLDSRYALTALIKWSNRGVRFTSELLVAHFVVFAVILCIPRARKEVAASLDGFLGRRVTRRTAMATVVGAAALAGAEFALGKTVRTMKALSPGRPKPNFLLITFDALNAEDMSLYGYGLPTTPNIDAFARKGTVFTNYYSAATFTTPSVATMLTGLYPSESHIHQLQGRARSKDAGKSLPHEMRAAGYATGGFLSNPFAHNFADSLGTSSISSRSQPSSRVVCSACGMRHRRCTRIRELEAASMNSLIWKMCGISWAESNSVIRFGYGRSRALNTHWEVLAKLPDGFFLWIHVITPHSPYIPDQADRGRFLHYDEQGSFEEESTAEMEAALRTGSAVPSGAVAPSLRRVHLNRRPGLWCLHVEAGKQQ